MILLSAFRMKNNHVRNKLATSVSKYLTEAATQLDRGPEDHLEYFLDSLDVAAKDTQANGKLSNQTRTEEPKISGESQFLVNSINFVLYL